MIERLLNHPRLLHQTADEEDGIPEGPVAGSVDANGMIVLSQEGRDLVLNRASVAELGKMLRELRDRGREVAEGES